MKQLKKLKGKAGFSLDQMLITIVLLGVLAGGVGYAVTNAREAAEDRLIADTEAKLSAMLVQAENTGATPVVGTESGVDALIGGGFYVDVNNNGSNDGNDIVIQATVPVRLQGATITSSGTDVTVTL
jgi:type II secretory pathway pseudopilin PulG